jgi:hypothetical protein
MGTEVSGFESLQKQYMFSSPKGQDGHCGLPSFLPNGYSDFLPARGQEIGEVTNLMTSASSNEAKNLWSYTSTSQYVFIIGTWKQGQLIFTPISLDISGRNLKAGHFD